MYSESFKSKVNLSKNEDEASRENSRDLKKNVYLREIERKRKYLEKIEKNKELPDQFFQQAKKLNMKNVDPEAWQAKQRENNVKMIEAYNSEERKKEEELEKVKQFKSIGKEYFESTKISKDASQSLGYQLQKESKRIKEFGQVKQLKMKVGQLDGEAEIIYKKAKFSEDVNDQLEKRAEADEKVVQSMMSKLYLINNLEKESGVKSVREDSKKLKGKSVMSKN